MSASEKLKTLGDPYPTHAYQRRLASVLPQIVAVVEAAEDGVYANRVAAGENCPCSECVTLRALTALDEALPGGDEDLFLPIGQEGC